MKKLLILLILSWPLAVSAQQATVTHQGLTAPTLYQFELDTSGRVRIVVPEHAYLNYNPVKKPYKLTLQDVKNVIAFDHSEGIGRSLVGLVDVWYLIAKKEGKSDEQAAEFALKSLANKLKSLTKNVPK